MPSLDPLRVSTPEPYSGTLPLDPQGLYPGPLGPQGLYPGTLRGSTLDPQGLPLEARPLRGSTTGPLRGSTPRPLRGSTLDPPGFTAVLLLTHLVVQLASCVGQFAMLDDVIVVPVIYDQNTPWFDQLVEVVNS